MEVDLSAGVRSFLKNTIFAHPDDVKADKKKPTNKGRSKKKKGQ